MCTKGQSSDKEVFKKSKIMDKINPGDLVMVDRGFNVRDMLQKDADIVNPPFLGNRTNKKKRRHVLSHNYEFRLRRY